MLVRGVHGRGVAGSGGLGAGLTASGGFARLPAKERPGCIFDNTLGRSFREPCHEREGVLLVDVRLPGREESSAARH